MSERTYGGHGLRRLRMISSTAQADPVTCSVAIKALPDLVAEHDRLTEEVARLRKTLSRIARLADEIAQSENTSLFDEIINLALGALPKEPT